MGETKNLYNPHDGVTGRDGGPYLDDQERRLAEVVRAAKEDREPDFEKAPATAGTPLVTASELVNTANPASNPSQMGADPYALAVDTLAKDESFPVNAYAEREVTEAEKQAEKDAQENNVLTNPANPTVISRDDTYTDENTKEQNAALQPSKETAKANSDGDKQEKKPASVARKNSGNTSSSTPAKKSTTTKKAAAKTASASK